MKTIALLSLLLSFALPALAQDREVDLDRAFLRATSLTSSVLKLESFRMEVPPRGTDVSHAFPPIVKQSPFGACQTFSMTAMMEYLFWRETGRTLKLSEKQMAHSLLSLMIDDLWNKETRKYDKKPNLGLGVAGFMIETVARAGLLPNADYPWGDYEAEGTRSIDVALFNSVFENEKAEHSPEEYKRLLDEAFLSPPPRAFRYTYKGLNFQTGKEEELTIKTPAELARSAGFAKERFLVLHNSSMAPTFGPMKPEDVMEALKFMAGISERFGVRNRTTTGDDISRQIVRALDNRMVVLIALDVWSGSWTDKLVYAGGGGHGVVVTGYQIRDGELWFKMRNSWGTGMGLGGYNIAKAAHVLPNLYYAIFFE